MIYGLFLDFQTELTKTPPLLLWCGGAVGFHNERERAAVGQETQSRFPWWESPLACYRFIENKIQWMLIACS